MGKLPPLAITLIKVIIHLIALATLGYLYLLISNDRLGADPVKEMIHFLGKTGLNYLLVTLAITPLCKRFKQPLLINLRRLLGLYGFFFISLHLLAFLWLELNWAVLDFFNEVVLRPYLSLGALAWVILLLLSITSVNALRKRMRRHWLTLHRFVYWAAIFAVIHYYWSVKSGVIEAGIYVALCLLLLLQRKQYFLSWLKRR